MPVDGGRVPWAGDEHTQRTGQAPRVITAAVALRHFVKGGGRGQGADLVGAVRWWVPEVGAAHLADEGQGPVQDVPGRARWLVRGRLAVRS